AAQAVDDTAGRSSFFFFQAEDGIRDGHVTGVQTCALPISRNAAAQVQPRTCERWLAEIHDFTRPRAAAFRGDLAPETILASLYQIGRASCRERVEISEGGGRVKTHSVEQEAQQAV